MATVSKALCSPTSVGSPLPVRISSIAAAPPCRDYAQGAASTKAKRGWSTSGVSGDLVGQWHMTVATKSLSEQVNLHCAGMSYKRNRQFLWLTVGLAATMGTATSRGTYLPATLPCSA